VQPAKARETDIERA